MSLTELAQRFTGVLRQLRELAPAEEHHERHQDNDQVIATRKNR
jgi:hypothetical protein